MSYRAAKQSNEKLTSLTLIFCLADVSRNVEPQLRANV
jgi:hypothetical protein